MATFFANLIPYIALLWALSLALFYRRLFLDFSEKNFDFDDSQLKIIPMWAMLGFCGLFILVLNNCIKLCVIKTDIDTASSEPYDKACLTFSTDYMRENPVTKEVGIMKLFDQLIKNEADKEKQAEMIRKKEEAERQMQGKRAMFSAY
jgi:hypothetical protein